MTSDHLLEIASVTKTMTGVVMMQLVQEGKVSLDDRVVKYPFLSWYNPVRVNPEIRLRHALTHTSQGPLGETYCYQGNRFGLVLGVFGTATPEKFLNGEAVARRILDPLHMENTFPRPGVAITDALKARVVKTYAEFNPTTGDPIPSPYIRELGSEAFPAGGFYSNVGDLTRFATALNDHSLLSKESQDFMESPTLTPDGRALPYGIGWFTQNHGGLRLLWHYGYADGDVGSALLLRVPEKKLCLAVLANSGNMSGSTRLGYGDALDSPFTVAFLKHFVHAGETPHPSPPYDGGLAEIRAAAADLIQKQAHPIYFEELFTQAVIRELMAGPNHDRRKAAGLLEIALDLRPEILRDSGLTGLEVLARLDDPKLGPAAVSLAQSLLQTPAPHPAALFFGAEIFEKAGRRAESVRFLQRLADSSFEDDPLTFDACVKMGEHFTKISAERARAYFWRAVRIGSASPGRSQAKLDRALQLLNALDRP
jgi:CubicO group peptidase (beta-lactamase class C family)